MNDPVYAAQAKEIAALCSENAKLKKFATVLWEMTARNSPMWTWKDMEGEARELGIEAV